jgi:hypothetical protein
MATPPQLSDGTDFRRLWLLGGVAFAQLVHLGDHIVFAVTGRAVIGPAATSELTHFLFNGAIALLSIALVRSYSRNPWVYPLLAVAWLHELEHVVIYVDSLRSGLSGQPGLLGIGGLLGVLPVTRTELHNAYNGLELILLALGFWHEVDPQLDPKPASAIAT